MPSREAESPNSWLTNIAIETDMTGRFPIGDGLVATALRPGAIRNRTEASVLRWTAQGDRRSQGAARLGPLEESQKDWICNTGGTMLPALSFVPQETITLQTD